MDVEGGRHGNFLYCFEKKKAAHKSLRGDLKVFSKSEREVTGNLNKEALTNRQMGFMKMYKWKLKTWTWIHF